jgi:uncharacterized protein (TIGR02145 family)
MNEYYSANKTFAFTLTILTIFLFNCTKKYDDNNPPVCNIISPIQDSIYWKSSPIPVWIETSDSDGNFDRTDLILDGTFIKSFFNESVQYQLESDLLGNKTINLTAVAIDNLGLTDTAKVSFTIKKPGLPEIQTRSVHNSSNHTAIIEFEIIDNSGYEITESGVCWGIENFISSNSESLVNANHPGTFQVNANNLSYNRTYFFKAFARNEAGIQFGEVISMYIPAPYDSIIDPRDEQQYKTIDIGGQIWFAENLNYYYKFGLHSFRQNVASEYEKRYGLLYDGDIAPMICPPGWKLPSDSAWAFLEMSLGLNPEEAFEFGGHNSGQVGKKIMDNGWLPGIEIVGFSGFNATGGGIYHNEPQYLTHQANFWTISEESPGNRICRNISASGNLRREYKPSDYGLSIRCIKGVRAPHVGIISIDSIASFNVIATCELVDDGGSAILSQGICCGFSKYPNKDYKYFQFESTDNKYTISASELEPDTRYYFRAYATNEVGISYSPPIEVITKIGFRELVDPRDGRRYKTVKIGANWWMEQNLNFETSEGSWCYAKEKENCEVYGRLYAWNTAKIACPVGWKLPTDQNWLELEAKIGIHSSEYRKMGVRGDPYGKKLKSTIRWRRNNGTNESGFNALPAGFLEEDSTFIGITEIAGFWAENHYFSTQYMSRWLSDNTNLINRDGASMYRGLSVRCIKMQ